jgi:antitoxin (DNA-binding transcriptional repressor) of toxin-antitoxin stability system
MSETISIENASCRLAELIHGRGPTDEIVLTENETPVARILPSNSSMMARIPGRLKGKLTIISNDDEHLADFKDYLP